MGVITAMDNVLNKLEANLSADPSQMQDIHTAQVEYLNMAREGDQFSSHLRCPGQSYEAFVCFSSNEVPRAVWPAGSTSYSEMAADR